MKKTQWLARTAICLALLIGLQFITKSLGQLVTGSCVNLVMGAATLLVGVWSGVVIALISPALAFLLGIGPAFPMFIPCIAAGNAVFVLLIGLLSGMLLENRKTVLAYCCVIPAAFVKFLTLYLLLVKFVAPMVVPSAKLATVTVAFSWPQLVTATIGGLLAVLLASRVGKTLYKGKT